MSLLQNIVCEIADREGIDPVDVEPPLNDVVDLDALETLVTGTESRQNAPSLAVKFEYNGYTVNVDGAGGVSISRETTTMDDVSRKKLDRSLENISAEIDHRKHALKRTGQIIADHERSFGERLDGLLGVVRETLGMESATLSYVNDGSYVFEAVDVTPNVDIRSGDIVPLAETACKRVVETEQALVLKDVEEDAPELANTACDVSSYIGVPVFVDGEVYGTFCFYDKDARAEEFTDWDLAFVELLSNWVSCELEQRRRERTLHAITTERPYAVD